MKKITVCHGPHCSFRGAPRILMALQTFFAQRDDVHIAPGACAGFCEEGPNVIEDEELIYHAAKASDIAQRIERRDGKKIVAVTPENLDLDEDFLPLL